MLKYPIFSRLGNGTVEAIWWRGLRGGWVGSAHYSKVFSGDGGVVWEFFLFVCCGLGFLFVYEISQKKANLFHMATYVQYVALNQVGINWSLNKKCHSWLSGWYSVWYHEIWLWQMPSPERFFYFIVSFASASSCKRIETPTTDFHPADKVLWAFLAGCSWAAQEDPFPLLCGCRLFPPHFSSEHVFPCIWWYIAISMHESLCGGKVLSFGLFVLV